MGARGPDGKRRRHRPMSGAAQTVLLLPHRGRAEAGYIGFGLWRQRLPVEGQALAVEGNDAHRAFGHKPGGRRRYAKPLGQIDRDDELIDLR